MMAETSLNLNSSALNSSALNASADTSFFKPESLEWKGETLEYSSIKLTEEDINRCLDYVDSFRSDEIFGIRDDAKKAANLPRSVKLANVLKWKQENEAITPSKSDTTRCVEVLCRAPRLVTYPELVDIFEKLPSTFRNLIEPHVLFSRCFSITDDLGRLPMAEVRDFLFELNAVINHYRLLQEFAGTKVGWLTEKELKSFLHHLVASCDLYEDIRESPGAVYCAEAFTNLICFRFEVRDNGSIEIRKLLCTKIIPHIFGETSEDDMDSDRLFFSKNRVLDSMDAYLNLINGDGFSVEDLSVRNPDILPVFFDRYMHLFGLDKLYFLEWYRMSYALYNLKNGKALAPVIVKHFFECIDIDGDGCFSISDCAFFHEQMMADLERTLGMYITLDDYYDSLFDLANVPKGTKMTLKNLQSPAIDSKMFFNMVIDISYVSNIEQGGGGEPDSEE